MKSLVVVVLSLLSSAALAQEGPRFYLSTDRVFAPGQPAEVKLEVKDVERLQFRLYQIAQPAAYFDAQADLHRPKEDTGPPKRSVFSLLSRGARSGMRRVLDETRKQFAQAGRDGLKSALPEMHKAAIEGAESVTIERVVPILDKHQLLDVWELAFASTGSWTYTEVPIPVTEPGAYLVEATAQGQIAHTALLITDVALVTKQSSKQLLVWAVDPASGDPRPDTKITVKVRGEKKGESSTGGDGLARFDLGLESSPVIYGENRKSFALLDPRFFPANLPAPKVYVFTERPVYRPGQTAYVKGFAREIADEQYVVPKSSAVKIEIIDPRGEAFSTIDTTLSERGSFDAEVSLPQEPVFGTWIVYATIGDQRHRGEFKMLAFVKPEVRLSVRLDKSAIRSGEKIAGDVVGEYFFGAPYPGAQVKITVSRTRFFVPWYVDDAYAWYYSDAEYRNTARETVHETTCTLDARGECPFELTALSESEDFTYVVEAVAQDPTGKTIVGAANAAVTRGAFRLEITQAKLVVEPGSSQQIQVRAVDYAGDPVVTEVRVRVKAERVGKDGQPETVEVLAQSFRTEKDGIARVEIDPSTGGFYRVVAEATDDRSHEIKAEGFLFAAEGGSGIPYGPSDLELITDRKSYFAGDTATVLILAPSPTAHVLFAVEGGDLYQTEVLKTAQHAAIARVKIGDKQTPNFFVSASTVLGGRIYSRSRSVIVPPREKLLTIEVAPDRPKAQPGEEVSFTVHVTDWSGKPVSNAEVALGVVDEAIYAISPEIAVPIEAFFHHRKRNDVRTTDSISFRFFGSSRELAAQASLDGESPFRFGSLKPQEDDRKVFKDTAAWFASLITNEEGKATAKVKLPDNLTSWRATARVITGETAVGSGRGNVAAKKPLVVRAALPPRITEGDSGSGALMVQNLTGSDATFEAALEVSASAGDAQVEITFAEPARLKALSVREGETVRIPFTYRATGSGTAKLIARASGGEHKDGLQGTITVSPWATPWIESANGRTSEGSIAKHSLAIPESVDASRAQLRIELFASTLGAVRASLPYLIDYPYGCAEQTMSRFVPVLTAKAAAPDLAKDLPAMIASGLSRLALLQHEDGGWGWWEEDTSDLWMTSWVMEGLAEAKALGAEVPADRTDGGIAALQRMLSKKPPEPALRSFAIYALARHGVNQPAMLTALIEEAKKNELLPITIPYLALAAAASKDVALIAEAKTLLLDPRYAKKDAEGRLHWCDDTYDRADDHPLECTGTALRALIATSADAESIAGAEAWLMAQYEEERFGSTRQTAIAVRALAESAQRAAGQRAEVVVKLSGKEIAREVIEGSQSKVITPQVKLSGRVELELSQQGGGTLFHSVAVSGLERRESFAPAATSGFSIRRSFVELAGSTGAYTAGQSLERFEEGAPMLVRLEVTSDKAISHALIEDPRPAGIEAVDRDAGQQIEGIVLKPKGVHREHRDDRTAFFIKDLKKGRTELYYLARATLAGEYRTAPVRIESMYLPAKHHARSSSTVVRIHARK